MRLWSLLAIAACLAHGGSALAQGPDQPAEAGERSGSAASRRPRGRPKVKLDRLDFPTDVAGASFLKRGLRQALAREARRANWGAGRDNTIVYRFTVAELRVTVEDGVLRVRCTAFGELPRGKTAKGTLDYGGDPRNRNREVTKVLQIVARGVVTRLAELERVRRGDLERSRVRRPVLVD